MDSKVTIKENGTVLEALPNTMFKIKMEDGREFLATLKGKLRRSYVRIFPGDKVTVEMAKHDNTRGRIIRKLNR
jgi:translation initiation factor IF-1